MPTAVTHADTLEYTHMPKQVQVQAQVQAQALLRTPLALGTSSLVLSLPHTYASPLPHPPTHNTCWCCVPHVRVVPKAHVGGRVRHRQGAYHVRAPQPPDP